MLTVLTLLVLGGGAGLAATRRRRPALARGLRWLHRAGALALFALACQRGLLLVGGLVSLVALCGAGAAHLRDPDWALALWFIHLCGAALLLVTIALARA